MCSLCKGSQNLFCTQNGVIEIWPCPGCGAAGVRAQFGPPTISINEPQSKLSRKWGKKILDKK